MSHAIFAALAFLDFAAEVMGEQLMPITDAEHRDTEGENGWIDIRAAGFEDAGRTAGDDNAEAIFQLCGGRVAGLNVGINAEFTNAARDQVSILSPVSRTVICGTATAPVFGC